MRGIQLLPSKLHDWQEKAKQRSKYIATQTKRLSEVKLSRGVWRDKYFELKAENEVLKQALNNRVQLPCTKITGHSYSAEQILLALQLRHEGGCSYRSCAAVIRIVSVWLGLKWRIPAYTTIRNWDIKLGYSRLHHCFIRPLNCALIMDESISMGSEKILLLLGVDLERYDYSRPLKMEDIIVLDIGLSKSWKSEAITPRIAKVKKRDIELTYSCTDNGNNIVKALKDSGLIQIEDCSHALGNLMKKRYHNNATFKSLSAEVVKFKQRICNGKYAEYAPPKWRSKSRYMNLYPICKWSKRMLKLIDIYRQQTSSHPILEQLIWLEKYRTFVEQLAAEQAVIQRWQQLLKTEGLSPKLAAKCKTILAESEIADTLKTSMKAYLDRNVERAASLGKVICSSDIIESVFGKFKQRVGKHPQAGLTPGCLTISNYNHSFKIEEIKTAIEQTKMVNIEQWRTKNLPESIFQKKKKLLKIAG